MSSEIRSLQDLLDHIEKAVQDERVSLGQVMEEIGDRSFGPVLLLAGILTLAPLISGIPGVPVLAGILVMITAVQLLLRRDHYWLPQWLLKRSVQREKLCKALGWLRKPTRYVDKLFKERMPRLVKGPALPAIAIACICISLLTPAMEFVPFSDNIAGVSLGAFGLALINRDGLVAGFAFLMTAATFGVLAYLLFF
jgi:hypothetical protein